MAEPGTSVEARAAALEEILVETLHAAAVVVGTNFRFGHKAAGDVALLHQLGVDNEFMVEGIALGGGPQVWSSTFVRNCLATGDVEGVFWATGQGLRVLPGHEELVALRMRAHARAGDLAAVRAEWGSYERALAADPWSDAEPAPKLVDLRRELLGATAADLD